MNANLPVDTEAQEIRDTESHQLSAALKVSNLNARRLTRSTEVELDGYIYLQVEDSYFTGCKRCGGTGHYSFNGYDSICYLCNDNPSSKLGTFVGDRSAAEKHAHNRRLARERRLAKAEEKRMVEVRKMEAKQAALKEAAPDVYEFLMGVVINPFADFEQEPTNEEYHEGMKRAEKSSFIRAMAESLLWVSQADKPFTEKMIEAVRKTIAQRAERAVVDAARPAVPEGRVQITGTILSTKIVEGDYGTAYKILVEDETGFRVYGSLAKSLVDFFSDEFYTTHEEGIQYKVGYTVWFEGSSNEPELYKGVKGRKITFSATVEPSKDDKSFGFFSRPTKAAVVA
jgi:hypothetical protein